MKVGDRVHVAAMGRNGEITHVDESRGLLLVETDVGPTWAHPHELAPLPADWTAAIPLHNED